MPPKIARIASAANDHDRELGVVADEAEVEAGQARQEAQAGQDALRQRPARRAAIAIVLSKIESTSSVAASVV